MTWNALYMLVEIQANVAGSSYLDWVTDDFQNAIAAPLPNPFTADKKGSWQITTNLSIPGNQPSVGNSIFLIDETVEGGGDITDVMLIPDGVSTVSRLPGYGVYIMFNGTVPYPDMTFGFTDASNNTGVLISSQQHVITPGNIPVNDTGWNELVYATLSKGFLLFRRSDDLVSWYLEYVSRRSGLPSSNLYPMFACSPELGSRLELGRLTCGQLGYPLNNETDAAHRSRIGVVSEAETLSMIPNMLFTWDINALPTTGNTMEFSYRRLDQNNRLYLRIDDAGIATLGEVIDGVDTVWATATTAITAGQAITLKAVYVKHQLFADDTLILEYDDPNERLIDADDTIFEYVTAGGGEIQDLFLWRYMQPRQTRELLRTVSSKASTLGWDF